MIEKQLKEYTFFINDNNNLTIRLDIRHDIEIDKNKLKPQYIFEQIKNRKHSNEVSYIAYYESDYIKTNELGFRYVNEKKKELEKQYLINIDDTALFITYRNGDKVYLIKYSDLESAGRNYTNPLYIVLNGGKDEKSL
jgi:hypothetical protein